MADRIPLIINSAASQIQELAVGDNLDLTGSNISNVGNITVASSINTVDVSATGIINVTGNLTSGNVSSTNLTLSGTGNVANLVTTKYNETVVTGGSVSGTISPDVASGTIFKYTLTGDITLNSLTNSVAGSGCTLILTQDGTGSRTLTSTMLFLGGTKTLSTAAGSVDIVSVFYDGTTYYATLGKGYV